MMLNTALEIEQWLNEWQNIALLSNPRKLVVEAGRRGGKTEKILSHRTASAMTRMPGSSGFLAGKSYSKLLDQMIPGLIAGWTGLGLVEDEDFVIAKSPPRGFKRPLICPKKWDHFILRKNGSGAHIISMDHGVTSNTLTTDWGAIDEAKQINPIRVKSELMKTMSGHRTARINADTCWGDYPEHRQVTLLTDKYIGTRDFKWVDGYKKEAVEMMELYRIMRMAERVQNNKNEILQRKLWATQKKTTGYIEYSSRAN